MSCSRTQTADIRMICATNKDLKAMVADGTFRDDLFYRINIFPSACPRCASVAKTFLRVR
jgi:transcriptional regulator with GAF, ATPase, and Fis domain